MRLDYILPANPKDPMPVPEGAAGFEMDGIHVDWWVKDGNLLNLVLTVHRQPLRFSETGYISLEYPELSERIYRVASFVADRIKVQTLQDVVDTNLFISSSASWGQPEDETEVAECKGKSMCVSGTPCQLLWNNCRHFDPSGFATDATHPHVYSFLADSFRASSVFQKYDLLYKVVDYFFDPLKKEALYSAVSEHVSPFDPTYTPSVVKELHMVRNRIAHPKAKYGHLNPQNSADERAIRDRLGQMRQLAVLLAEHPRQLG